MKPIYLARGGTNRTLSCSERGGRIQIVPAQYPGVHVPGSILARGLGMVWVEGVAIVRLERSK